MNTFFIDSRFLDNSIVKLKHIISTLGTNLVSMTMTLDSN